MFSVITAPVVDFVTQEIGLFENFPAPFALVTLTVLALVAHPDNCADTEDAPVPPPTSVSGGENEILADTEHRTDPGAATTECRSEEILAAAGFPPAKTPVAARSPTANEDHIRLVKTLPALVKRGLFTEAPISRVRALGGGRRTLLAIAAAWPLPARLRPRTRALGTNSSQMSSLPL
jgi:hypothetical protein